MVEQVIEKRKDLKKLLHPETSRSAQVIRTQPEEHNRMSTARRDETVARLALMAADLERRFAVLFQF
jgi:hypothetical protein